MYLYGSYQKKPSFLIGVARILDITVSLSSHERSYKPDSKYEDFYAIYSDWKAVGDDIKGAIGTPFLLSE